jgi:hypothetical protein
MGNRSRQKAIVVWAITMLAGCEATTVQNSGGTRLLTAAEMDQVTVGSANATIDIAARALPPAAQTTASDSTLTISDVSSNYSSSQAAAAATSGQLAGVNGSSHTAVSGASSGASIDATGTATAAGGGTSRAQMTMQFVGVSMSRADLVFGTAIASACCAPSLGAQVTGNGAAGGPYSTKLQGYSMSDIPGQVQSRVDIAVVSSALPIVDPGQVMGLLTARGPPNY